MSKNWHPFAILLAGIAVSQLSVGIATVGAVDGVNGTAGPAMLDVDTGQLFDSQHPDHVLVAGTQTLTLTGHGTHTLTSLGTLYGTNGIGFVNTNTVTVTGSHTQTNTSTWSSSSSYTVTGTGILSGTRTDASGAAKNAPDETFMYPQTQSKTMTATSNMPVGTTTSSTNQTGNFASTHTVTGSQTYTTTVSSTASATVTATGAYTGTNTATGTVTGSQTGTGTGTASHFRLVTVTRTISATSTASGAGNTWTVTDSAATTGTSSKTATYLEESLTMTATKTTTSTWTGSQSSSGNGTDTLTATNTFTVTTTSNSASVSSNPTVAHANRYPGGAYIVATDGCYLNGGGICSVTMWRRPSWGSGVPHVYGITSSSGVVEILGSTHYEPGAWYAVNPAERMIWPAGTWRLRVRAEASSLRYRSFIRAEVIAYGKHKPTGVYPDGQQSCVGNVDSIIPTGMVMDFPVTMEGSGGRLFTLEAHVGGPSASVEQAITKNFHFEPNYPTGWNTQCTSSATDDHPPVHLGVSIKAYTESPDPVDIYFYTADLDSPVPAMP